MPVAVTLRRIAALVVLLFSVVLVGEAMAQEARPKRAGKKYRVRIDSAPQQAAVYLDDEKYGIVGYTPWSGSLQKGDWTVIVKKDGYEVGRKIISVARKSAVQETFIPLTKKIEPAVLDVRPDADPSSFGAQVWVDGQQQGTIPALINVTAGRHLVEIKKPDFDTFSQWVEVKDGEKVTINPMMRGQARGAILVNSDVPDAEIYLDGNKLDDRTPTLINNVLEGPHIVEVRKPPAMPWKQTVQVTKGQTTKVTAELKASAGGQGGNIRVLSNSPRAEVYLDGTLVGPAPIDLKDVRPGEHLIEVKAPGFRPREETVTVAAGSALVLKMDLGEAGAGTIRVVSTEPEAQVFIDGEKLGTAPQEKAVSAGEHFVVVQKEGWAKFERKVTIEPGDNQVVQARLEQVGGVRFVSTPSGAQVLVDGRPIGVTPMVDEQITAGEHVVTIRKQGFADFETPIKVEAGKVGVVNAALEIYRDKSDAELALEQRGLSAFGARAMPRGRSIAAFGAGYPYLLDGRFVVGAPKLAGAIGFDAGLSMQLYSNHMQAALLGRLTFFDVEPFSFGAFAELGGGQVLFDQRSRRNTYYLNAGGAASLTGLGAVTVTGRAYFNAYSDRHCPGLRDDGQFESKSSPTELCKNYREDRLNPDVRARIDELLGGEGKIFERDDNVRFMTSIIVEVAFKQHWSVWFMMDFVPFFDERAAFTDAINGLFVEDDIRTYPRLGLTYKF
jgi:hypothetical protein